MNTRATTTVTDPTDLGPAVAADPPSASLSSKLLRYLYPVGLLDEPRGDLFAHEANLRRNLESLRRHGVHYLRVHAVLAALFGLALAGAQAGGCGPLQLPCAVGLGVEVSSAVAFLGLVAALRLR